MSSNNDDESFDDTIEDIQDLPSQPGRFFLFSAFLVLSSPEGPILASVFTQNITPPGCLV